MRVHAQTTPAYMSGVMFKYILGQEKELELLKASRDAQLAKVEAHEERRARRQATRPTQRPPVPAATEAPRPRHTNSGGAREGLVE